MARIFTAKSREKSCLAPEFHQSCLQCSFIIITDISHLIVARSSSQTFSLTFGLRRSMHWVHFWGLLYLEYSPTVLWGSVSYGCYHQALHGGFTMERERHSILVWCRLEPCTLGQFWILNRSFLFFRMILNNAKQSWMQRLEKNSSNVLLCRYVPTE